MRNEPSLNHINDSHRVLSASEISPRAEIGLVMQNGILMWGKPILRNAAHKEKKKTLRLR